MYGLIAKNLQERDTPVHVAVVGAGWFGRGLTRELMRIEGIEPKVLIDRNPGKAVSAYLEAGLKRNEIVVIKSAQEIKPIQNSEKFLVLSDIELLREMEQVDVVYDATGNIYGGTRSVLVSIEKGFPFVTVNFEMCSTIGFKLASLAKEKGVLYSHSDGDQPGVLAKMIEEITTWGFEPKIVGNCKGFLDVHQDPTGVKPFIPPRQDTRKICSMADGTKQSFEMAVLGNAFGYLPLKRGMYGPTTSKSRLIQTYDDLIDLKSLQGTYVDYVLGINGVDQGGGVFIISYREGPHVKEDMKFLKKGEGPFYLFFRDYHLTYFEAVRSIAEAVLFGHPTSFPKGKYIEVVSRAKRDLPPGHSLDGIGGYDCYGEVERADTAFESGLLPIGLAEFATARKKIPRDTLITYDMVELHENLVVQLRREQDSMPFF